LRWFSRWRQSRQPTKTSTFDFSKEKNHEENHQEVAGNCVAGRDRSRFRRSGAGGERSVLRLARMLRFLRWLVLAAS
jgi:hypothetical protein